MKVTIKKYLYLAILSVVTIIFGSPYTSPLNKYLGYDSAYYMIIGKAIVNGKILYKDLGTTYGPIHFFINAFGFLISSGKLGIMLLQIIAMFVSLILIQKVNIVIGQKKYISNMVLVSYCLMYIGIIGEGDMTEEWSLPFICASVFFTIIFIISKEEYPIWMGYLQGVLFAIVALIRINNSVLIVSMVFSAVVILIIKKKYINILFNGIFFLLGFSTIFFIISVYFILNNSFNEFIYYAYLRGVVYAGAGASNKLIQDYLLILFRLLPEWICMIIAILQLLKTKNEIALTQNNKIAITIIISSIFSFVVMIFGNGWTHYYLMLLPLTVMVWCIVGDDFFKIINKKKWFSLSIAAMSLLLPFGYYVARNTGRDILLNFTDYYQYRLDEANVIANCIPEEDKDRVLAYEVFPQIYLYLDIIPEYRMFAFQESNTKNDSALEKDFKKEIEDKRPIWLIVQGATSENKSINFFDASYNLVEMTTKGWNLGLYKLE